MGALFADANVITIAAFISPYKADRDQARRCYPQGEFFEVFLDCPLEICEKRDPKGLYQKARRGEISDFTGIHAPYEKPDSPDLLIDTTTFSIEDSVRLVWRMLEDAGIFHE